MKEQIYRRLRGRILTTILKCVVIVSVAGGLILPNPTVQAETKQTQFSDITGHWAESAINNMVKQGVLNGFPDGTFRPDDPVQVDQFLKMILMSLSEVNEYGERDWKDEFIERTSSFTKNVLYYESRDFKFENASSGYWAKPFVDQAVNMVIIDGKYDRWGGDFTKTLNREDVAYIVFRTIGMIEESEEHNYMYLAKGQIKDLNRVKHDEQDVLQVYMKGIMRGYPDGTFGVRSIVTRAEAATLLNRILDRSNRNPYQPDLSALPHDIVPTEFGDEKVIVFPSWNMKRAYDTLQNNRKNSLGYTSQTSNRVFFYKDEETYHQDMERYETLAGAFTPPLQDVAVAFDTSINQYSFNLSTKSGAFKTHEEAVRPFLEDVFDKDADSFISHLNEKVKQIKDRKFKTTDLVLNGRKVIFFESGPFLVVSILPNQ